METDYKDECPQHSNKEIKWWSCTLGSPKSFARHGAGEQHNEGVAGTLVWERCARWSHGRPRVASRKSSTAAKSLKSFPTLCNPMDCNPPGSSVHGIFQARIQEWVAISFSRGSSWPREWNHSSCLASGFFTTELLGEPKITVLSDLKCFFFFFLMYYLCEKYYKSVYISVPSKVLVGYLG